MGGEQAATDANDVAPSDRRGIRGAISDLVHDRDRLIFWVGVVIACLPIVVSVVWAIANHRWFAGDRSIMGVLTHDVFSRNTPLLSTPSTMRDYAESADAAAVHHLGPIQFWLLAIPDWLLGGRPAGLLVGGMIINCTAIVVLAVFVRRRMGPLVAAAAVLLVVGLSYGLGPELLREIWTPFLGLFPILCLIVLVWSLLDGDVQALPWAVFWATFLAQIELLYVAPTAVLALGGGIGFILFRLRHRLADRRADRASEPRPEALPRLKRPIIASVIVVVFFWWPPVYQQLMGNPGNMTALAEALGHQKARIPSRFALHNMVSLVSFNPTWTRRVWDSFSIGNDPSKVQWVSAVVFTVLFVLALVLAWRSRRHAPSRWTLAVTGSIVVAASVVNLRIMPADAILGLQYRRWMWPFSAFIWFTLAVIIGGWISDREWSAAFRRRWGPIGAVALIAISALVVIPASIGQDTPPTDDLPDNLVVESMWGPVLERLPRQPTFVQTIGLRSLLGQGPEIIRRLVANGFTVRVLTNKDIDYGAQRTLSKEHPADQTLQLLSSDGSLAPGRSPVAVLGAGRRDGKDADGFAVLANELLPDMWGQPPIVLKPESFQRVVTAFAADGQSAENAADVLTNPARAMFDRSILKEIADGGATISAITPEQAKKLYRGLHDVQTIAYLMPAPDPAHPNAADRVTEADDQSSDGEKPTS